MARELIDPLPTDAQKGGNFGSSNELGFHFTNRSLDI